MKLIPYTHIDGLPTFRDSAITGFYDRMVKEGSISKLNMDGYFHSAQALLADFKNTNNIYCVAIDEESGPLGFTWVNRIEHKRAFIHFCLFKNAWGDKSADIARDMIDFYLGLRIGAEYRFDILIGLIHAKNRLAVKTALKCGGVLMGDMPHALWNATENKSADGTLLYFVRHE